MAVFTGVSSVQSAMLKQPGSVPAPADLTLEYSPDPEVAGRGAYPAQALERWNIQFQMSKDAPAVVAHALIANPHAKFVTIRSFRG